MITKIREYFKGIKIEMSKVSWMSRNQVVNSTILVGIFSFIIAMFLFVLDIGLSELINVLFNFV